MADCAPCVPPVDECYPIENPCTSYAQVYNALIKRAVGGATVGFRVGEESFQFSHLSYEQHVAMADNLYKLCKACGGCPPPVSAPRGRAKVCFVPGDHHCRLCGQTSCGCRR